jgi:serine protease Do
MRLYSNTQILGILLTIILTVSSRNLSQNSVSAQKIAQNESSQLIKQVAQKVTVRLVSKSLSGSGVIVSHQNQKYKVLTCAHVLGVQNINEFRLLTPDGQLHSIEQDAATNFKDLDLALISFQSTRHYNVIKPAQSQNAVVGSPAYVSGFPNYQYRNADWRDTSTSGVDVFRLYSGQIVHLLNQAMAEGYRIGLTNDIEIGMSGGPVLNAQGELIAIAGRTKYAPAGIDAYQFIDGTQPSKELLEEMEVASWAIPVPQSLSFLGN